jgi:hypothetical protein
MLMQRFSGLLNERRYDRRSVVCILTGCSIVGALVSIVNGILHGARLQATTPFRVSGQSALVNMSHAAYSSLKIDKTVLIIITVYITRFRKRA